MNGTPAALHESDRIRSDDLAKVFKWTGKQNYFANFEAADVREWKEKDPDKSIVGMLSFPKFDDDKALAKLWDATPDWFRPLKIEQVTGFGVPIDVEKKLLAAWPEE